MLSDLGVQFEILVPNIPEEEVSGETPEDHALRLGRQKAEAVADAHPDALILGADTAVVIDGLILGKPVDTEDARRMLGLLAGRDHIVVSAFALLAPDLGISHGRAVTSRVFIRSLTGDQIRRYVQTGEPMDKAGGYAIQGVGAGLVKKVEGSYTCVVGLPLAELIEDIEGLLGPRWLYERKKERVGPVGTLDMEADPPKN